VIHLNKNKCISKAETFKNQLYLQLFDGFSKNILKILFFYLLFFMIFITLNSHSRKVNFNNSFQQIQNVLCTSINDQKLKKQSLRMIPIVTFG